MQPIWPPCTEAKIYSSVAPCIRDKLEKLDQTEGFNSAISLLLNSFPSILFLFIFRFVLIRT